MSSTQLQQFLARVFQDPELESRLQASAADPESIAAEAGFAISAQDYVNSQAGWQDWQRSSSYDEDI